MFGPAMDVTTKQPAANMLRKKLFELIVALL
jgi:hypothetical protein